MSIANVARTGNTVATLTLMRDSGDITANGTLSVTVLDAAHTGSGDLTTGSVSIMNTTAPTATLAAPTALIERLYR